MKRVLIGLRVELMPGENLCSRRREEAEKLAILDRNPPPHVGGYEDHAISKLALRHPPGADSTHKERGPIKPIAAHKLPE